MNDRRVALVEEKIEKGNGCVLLICKEIAMKKRNANM
jgi:hypothetical protein